MGDRCSVNIRVHKDDIEKDGWKTFLEEEGPPESEDGPGWWAASECNYALFEERSDLAASGVRFYGFHSEGGEYPACLFASDGERCDDRAVTHELIGVAYDGDPLQILAHDVDGANDFLRRYHAAMRAVDESWGERRTEPATATNSAKTAEEPKAKHTPGPWTVDRSMVGELEPWDARNNHLLRSESRLPLEEREANGWLIATAPDQHAALLVIARTPHIRSYLEEHDPKALQQVDAAIAKAQGRS